MRSRNSGNSRIACGGAGSGSSGNSLDCNTRLGKVDCVDVRDRNSASQGAIPSDSGGGQRKLSQDMLRSKLSVGSEGVSSSAWVDTDRGDAEEGLSNDSATAGDRRTLSSDDGTSGGEGWKLIGKPTEAQA